MPLANLLAKSQLAQFRAWLLAQGHAIREGRGDYQVIQVQLKGSPEWHAVFRRTANKEHYSVPWPLVPSVQQFILDKHADHHPTERVRGTLALRPEQAQDRDPAEGDGPLPWED